MKSFLFFFFFGRAKRPVGSWFPNQGWNPRPLQWKRGALTTGPQGSPDEVILTLFNVLSSGDLLFSSGLKLATLGAEFCQINLCEQTTSSQLHAKLLSFLF